MESDEEVMRYTVCGASLMKVMTVKRVCLSHLAREATSLTEVMHYHLRCYEFRGVMNTRQKYQERDKEREKVRERETASERERERQRDHIQVLDLSLCFFLDLSMSNKPKDLSMLFIYSGSDETKRTLLF